MKSKFQVNDFVRTAELKKMFSKSDLRNKLYKITEFISDKKPCYKIDKLPERYNDSLLAMSELTLNEIQDVTKILNITQIKSKCC